MRALPVALLHALLSACAQPATDVQVATMPMHAALEQARTAALPGPPRAAQPPRPAGMPRGAAQGLLSAPDVRLAYLYEWIDAEGNKHFGEWVAIPIAGFDWIMNDGSLAPVDNAAPPPGEPH